MKLRACGLAIVAVLLLSAAEARAQNAPGEAAPEYAAGRAAYARGDLSGARRAFQRAVALAPNNADYHYWLGRTLGMQALHASIFSRLSLARSAKAEFERAVALDPRSWEAREALVDYDVRAPGVAGGSKDEALVQARAMERLNPYLGGFEVEQVLLVMGRRADATAELRSLAAAYPDSMRPRDELRRTVAARR